MISAVHSMQCLRLVVVEQRHGERWRGVTTMSHCPLVLVSGINTTTEMYEN